MNHVKHPIYSLARTALCGAVLLSVAAATDFQTNNTLLSKGHLNVVCSTSLFHGVDRAELITSSKVWLQNVASHVGWAVNPQVELTDTVEAIKKRIDAAYSRSDASLSRMWVEVMLQERHLGSSEQFFRSYTSVSKPSAACLPLFFGKADACLIDDPSWNVLRELNPQVGGKLKALAESPAFLENLVAMHVNQKDHRAEIVRGMLGLQNNPEGRQILLFFKSQHPVAIEKQDLDSVIDLRSKYLKVAGAERKVVPVSITSHNEVPTTEKVR